MIKLVNVSKSFNDKSGVVKILDDVTLNLPDIGFVAICGKSGCGKTTLLKMLTGLITDYEGKILFDDINVNKLSKNKRSKFYSENVFYLKYNDNFFKTLKVKTAFDVYLNKKEKEKANELVSKFELHDLLNKRIKHLSSGELQKISLCISLSKQAKITILDEPICNMDNKSMMGFMDQICELSKKSLVIYVSHFEKDIDNRYDIKLRMYDGKFTIEHEKEMVNKQDNSNNVSNHFNLKRSLFCELVKPVPFYCLFRAIIVLMIVLSLYIAGLKNVSVSNVYNKSINQMSLNVVEISDESISNSALKETKMYKAPSNSRITTSYIYPLSIKNLQMISGFGKASDYYISGFNEKLSEKEIIISDFLAYECNISIGDQVSFEQILDVSNYGTTSFSKYIYYTVKYIYKTDYAIEISSGIEENDLPDWDKYIFFSDIDMDKMKDAAFLGFAGAYLDNGTYLASWKDEYANIKFFNDYDMPTLNDDEFFANRVALDYLGLSEIEEDWDTYMGGSDKYYDITFTFKGKSITKSLKYRKNIYPQCQVMVSSKTFNEIVDSLGITRDNALNFKNVKTIDFNDSNYHNIFNSIKDYDSVKFSNDSIIGQYRSKISSLVSFMETNSIYMYLFLSIFLILAFYEISKNEIRVYKMLREKNYNVISTICTTSFIKIVTWIIIFALLFTLKDYLISFMI